MKQLEVIGFVDIEVDGINTRDYPDFVDAYVASASAELEDGSFRDATEVELQELSEDSELIHRLVFDILF